MIQQLPIDPDKKGEVLRNARFAPLLRTARSDQAKQLEDRLTEITIAAGFEHLGRERRPRPEPLKNLKRTVSAFVADLLLHSENEDCMGFCYRSWNGRDFSETMVESRQFEFVIEAWVALGYLEVVPGFTIMDDFDGAEYVRERLATRYRATLPLLDHATELGIKVDNIGEHYELHREKMFPLVLRGQKGKDKGSNQYRSGKRLPIKKTIRTISIASEVKEINEFLARFSFSLPEPPLLRRIFNNGDKPGFDWDQGGRLYSIGAGGYQQMPSEQRRLITIDGENTVELDLRASHLTILYAMAGRSLDHGDPYAIADIPRDVVKFLVTAITGKGGLPVKWNKDLNAEHEARTGRKLNSDYPLKKTAQRVLDRHPILDLMDVSGLDTHRLQYVEAEILKTAILRLLKEFQVPSLPVHDSLIVREKDKDVAETVLKEEFKARIGVIPAIRVKGRMGREAQEVVMDATAAEVVPVG